MKQVLIRKPSVDITLKRVGDIGYIFIKTTAFKGPVTIDGIPKWFRMKENEIIGFCIPDIDTDEIYMGMIMYLPVFDESTGEFVEGQIELAASGWNSEISCSLVVNMNDYFNGEQGDE